MDELQRSFGTFFEAEWSEVLDAADKSPAYNAHNNAYFSVRDLRPMEDLTLEQLLEDEGPGRPLNVIAS